jgi:pyruvate dehydrogenase E2 component (dihydrolipoyllysine-residue acetyltransferase)
MPAYVTMPQLSDTMSEGTLIKWTKKVGEPVKQGATIAEVETDKATMEMEAFDSGTLALTLAKEGDRVAVGQPIAVLATGKESVDDALKWHASQGTGAAKATSLPPSPGTPGEGRGEGLQPSQPQVALATATLPQPKGNGDRPLRISPLARRIAADKGLDLSQIQGSGPLGRIIQRDVAAATTAAPALRPAALGSGQKQVIELNKMRLTIAKRLLGSKQNIPHFYETIDADVEELTSLRAGMNKRLEKQKIRLSLGDFVSRAIALALLDHPALNATFDGAAITRHVDVHLGMAVAIPDGLIVPVLKNIHKMGIVEIRQRSVDLADRARAQRLKQDEMSGATFTVSNLGAYGIREFSAIINPPEVAILAVGAAEKRAVVHGDTIAARTTMTLTLSADHRVVDGATAAEFLRTLKSMLQEPGMILV